MNRLILIFGFFILLISCKSTKISYESEFKISDDSVNLYAFIGKKISVLEFDPNENNTEVVTDTVFGKVFKSTPYIMDYAFKCKYRIEKNVFNELKTKTIDFVAYDHYGIAKFKNYKYIILYIPLDKEDGNYYHQKYQFDPVERTKNGTWQGLNGESIESLFNDKKNGVLTARSLFDK
ncbi:hypothetical protein [Winogradskyella undariae]|uniref:hypothetical protein n=1 Tax=Winogradskyella undariae TaxID=1285465 RepID=UPI0015CE7F9A|nr:hypothetical protein [Winogradskyella undariae]